MTGPPICDMVATSPGSAVTLLVMASHTITHEEESNR